MQRRHARDRPTSSDRGDRALVWRRRDFSESSRLVTLLSARLGKVNALAKGAHRPNSPFLGRLDLLNLVVPQLTGARGEGLRVLRGVELLHEPRALRQPARFLAAGHVADVFDAAFVDGRPDPDLFEILCGGLLLVERCPRQGLAAVLAGLELKCLAGLGALGDLTACGTCGARGRLFAGRREGGLGCTHHRPADSLALSNADLDSLRSLLATPGRGWPRLPRPTGGAIAALGAWVRLAIDRPTPQRRAAYTAAVAARPSAAATQPECS